MKDIGRGNGYAEETGNWTYCGMIPSLIRNDGTYRPERAFGVNSDVDNTGPYDAFFKEERGFVETLSFCILESYDFGQLYRKSNKRPRPEFLFRCVCAQDRCNDPNQLNSFLPRGASPMVDASLLGAAGIPK
ncbi:hypothetical protein AAVH_22795 [Aphelenchoides avenae]|nr:hypothetical protein AAVH_22795 [Aphelenchus avenae]